MVSTKVGELAVKMSPAQETIGAPGIMEAHENGQHEESAPKRHKVELRMHEARAEPEATAEPWRSNLRWAAQG